MFFWQHPGTAPGTMRSSRDRRIAVVPSGYRPPLADAYRRSRAASLAGVSDRGRIRLVRGVAARVRAPNARRRVARGPSKRNPESVDDVAHAQHLPFFTDGLETQLETPQLVQVRQHLAGFVGQRAAAVTAMTHGQAAVAVAIEARIDVGQRPRSADGQQAAHPPVAPRCG
jgi:hypothetical protein